MGIAVGTDKDMYIYRYIYNTVAQNQNRENSD